MGLFDVDCLVECFGESSGQKIWVSIGVGE